MKIESLKLDDIRIDGGTQPRARIDTDYVAELASAVNLPPVIVYFDGAASWLADGFHRYHAAAKRGDKKIECEIRRGTQRDAIRASLSANKTHGLRRSNADKRKGATIFLEDAEWSKMSDRAIAEELGVSHTFIAEMRAELATVATSKPVSEKESTISASKRTGRDGKKYTAKSPTQTAPLTVPPERPKDGRGKPAEIREVRKAIESVPTFKELIADAQALRRGIKDLAERAGGEELATGRAKELTVALDHIIAQLKNCIPYTACPFMPNCETGKCKTCKGKKWVTEQVWNNIPEDMRK